VNLRLGKFRRWCRRSRRSCTLGRSDTNAALLEHELRWPNEVELVMGRGKKRGKKKLTLNERSVGALRFQQYVGSCKVERVSNVLHLMIMTKKTYFLPFEGFFLFLFSSVSLSLIFGRLLTVSSTFDAWRLRVPDSRLDRVRGGIVDYGIWGLE
jgi:hypothetical protein